MSEEIEQKIAEHLAPMKGWYRSVKREYAEDLAPEVKRLIETAYQQGFMRGMNQVAEHLLAADTRLPIPSPSWGALLRSSEEGQ